MALQILTMAVKFAVDGHEGVFKRTWGTDNGNPQELVDNVVGVGLATYLPYWPADVEILEVFVEDLLDPDNYLYTILNGYVGTAATGTMPQFTAIGAYFPVSTPKQRGGSNRFPPPSEAQVDNSTLIPPYDDIWGVFLDIFSHVIVSVVGTYYPILISSEGAYYTTHLIVEAVLNHLTTQNSRKGYTEGGVSIAVGKTVTPSPAKNPTIGGETIETKMGLVPATGATMMGSNNFPFKVLKPTFTVPVYVPSP